ncbi:MAG TPA: hypothetical protein DCL43_00665 [Chitinophagaceae bacterium]|nr:hypothetical protein [Chitinophagaceae bacterium]
MPAICSIVEQKQKAPYRCFYINNYLTVNDVKYGDYIIILRGQLNATTKTVKAAIRITQLYQLKM